MFDFETAEDSFKRAWKVEVIRSATAVSSSSNNILLKALMLLGVVGFLVGVGVAIFVGDSPRRITAVVAAVGSLGMTMVVRWIDYRLFLGSASVVQAKIKAIDLKLDYANVDTENHSGGLRYDWFWRVLCEFSHNGNIIQATPNTLPWMIRPVHEISHADARREKIVEEIRTITHEGQYVYVRVDPKDPLDCKVVEGP